jgi:hypothetical protein
MRKLIIGLTALLVIATLTLSSIIPAFAATFPDITEESPRAKAVEYLVRQGIVSGYSDGTFKPTRYITRAELVKLLVTSQPGISLDEINYFFESNYLSNPRYTYARFPDVGLNQWYAKYIAYGAHRGWISGYPDGLFRPNEEVNMAEALKLTLEMHDVHPNQSTTQYLMNRYPSWYAKYLFTALEKKIFATAEFGDIAFTFMDKVNRLMYPETILTRENAAELLYRVLSMKESGGTCYSPDSYEWETYRDDNIGFSLQMPFRAYSITQGEKFQWNWKTPVGITSRRETKFAMKSFDNPLATPTFTVMTYTVRDSNLSLEEFARAIELDNENLELKRRRYEYYDASDWNIRKVKYFSELLDDERKLTSHGAIIKNGSTFFHIFSLDWHAPCDFEKVLDSFNFST